MLNHWILVGLLFIFTYMSRIIGLIIMAGREMGPSLRLYFNYVPIAIISALLVKQVLVPVDGQLTISLPVLTGCFCAYLIIKITKGFLPSVIGGIIIGLVVRYFYI
ncbi:MAG: AzlD domain-containing protein [Thermotaleaceae bacterium]